MSRELTWKSTRSWLLHTMWFSSRAKKETLMPVASSMATSTLSKRVVSLPSILALSRMPITQSSVVQLLFLALRGKESPATSHRNSSIPDQRSTRLFRQWPESTSGAFRPPPLKTSTPTSFPNYGGSVSIASLVPPSGKGTGNRP